MVNMAAKFFQKPDEVSDYILKHAWHATKPRLNNKLVSLFLRLFLFIYFA